MTTTQETYIVYPNVEKPGFLCVLIPTGAFPLEETAKKDVPSGLPYVFLPVNETPPVEFIDSWECDFSNPDGYGMGHDAWSEQQFGGTGGNEP